MAVTGLANLAVKVQDLESAVAFYRSIGASVDGPEEWAGARRADVRLGPVTITLFTRVIFEGADPLPQDCFSHPALWSDDLDAQLEGLDVIWGPEVVSGSFGRRRIAFVRAPGNIHLEFMEDLDDEGEAETLTGSGG